MASGYSREIFAEDLKSGGGISPEFKAILARPLVETAAELEAYLANPQDNAQYQPGAANGYADCKRMATPPCHASKSGLAFVYGDSREGGVTIRCMAACSPLYRTVENALGIRIQARMPNGRMRWRGGESAKRAAPPPKLPKREPPSPEPLFALPTPDGYSLDDLFAAKRWIVANGKRGAGFQYGGEYCGFRQSKTAAAGGVKTARYGARDVVETDKSGREYRLRVLAWGARRQVDALRGMIPNKPHFTTAIALSGDADTPADSAIGVIDFDYKPIDKDTGENNDPEGIGGGWRDSCLELLAAAGCPIWRSTSGNGFHAVFSAPADELGGGVWLREPQRYPPLGASHGGAGIDIYAPGAKRLVAFRFDKPAANTDSGAIIPTIAYRDMMAALAHGTAIPARDGGDIGDDSPPQETRLESDPFPPCGVCGEYIPPWLEANAWELARCRILGVTAPQCACGRLSEAGKAALAKERQENLDVHFRGIGYESYADYLAKSAAN